MVYEFHGWYEDIFQIPKDCELLICLEKFEEYLSGEDNGYPVYSDRNGIYYVGRLKVENVKRLNSCGKEIDIPDVFVKVAHPGECKSDKCKVDVRRIKAWFPIRWISNILFDHAERQETLRNMRSKRRLRKAYEKKII